MKQPSNIGFAQIFRNTNDIMLQVLAACIEAMEKTSWEKRCCEVLCFDMSDVAASLFSAVSSPQTPDIVSQK